MDQHRQSRDLYRPIYKDGTHLAPSKDTDGAVRGSLLDYKTKQVTGQAEWVKVDESEYVYDEPYDYQETRRESELSPEAQKLAQLVGEAIGSGYHMVGERSCRPSCEILVARKGCTSNEREMGRCQK